MIDFVLVIGKVVLHFKIIRGSFSYVRYAFGTLSVRFWYAFGTLLVRFSVDRTLFGRVGPFLAVEDSKSELSLVTDKRKFHIVPKYVAHSCFTDIV